MGYLLPKMDWCTSLLGLQVYWGFYGVLLGLMITVKHQLSVTQTYTSS